MKLPAINDKIINRPGEIPVGFDKCFIPNPEEIKFWERLYLQLSQVLQKPVSDFSSKIDPFFGYFGYRFHPVNFQPKYFHIGADIMAESGKKIYPVADGVLEYSGFGAVNGNYVMVSHPGVTTQDGFMLYSLYMHLERFYFRFNFSQKVLREIGVKRFATIPISRRNHIGEVGATGNIRGLVSHLHIQLEFRNKKRGVVAIDPVLSLGTPNKNNLTASISSVAEFNEFCHNHKNNLVSWARLWEKQRKQ